MQLFKRISSVSKCYDIIYIHHDNIIINLLFNNPIPEPGIPGEIEFLNVTMTTVNVTWKEPSQPNGVITSYELAYKQQQPEDGKCLQSIFMMSFFF